MSANETPVILEITIADQKSQLTALLKMGFVKVLFTKKSDGSDRVLIGTKMEDYIQGSYKTAHNPRKENEFIITIFDVELDEWRSFSLENIKRAWVVNDPELWAKADKRLYDRENEALRAIEESSAAFTIESIPVSADVTMSLDVDI